MNLPPTSLLTIDWKPSALDGWAVLVKATQKLESKAGKGDLFQEMVDQLVWIAKGKNRQSLSTLLTRRVAARALTQLWVEDKDFRLGMLNLYTLRMLVECQLPKLGIVTLQNLISVYFREFDQLDQIHEGCRQEVENVIKKQILIRHELTKTVVPIKKDLLSILHINGNWLLTSEGPKKFVDLTRAEDRELADSFLLFELRGLDGGRYGDICRAHYYLEILRNLPVGMYDDIFNELLKPSVNKAPFESGKRIGHIALEILIDRADGPPGDSWQEFILDLAGDPRIASSAINFREWWKPLGNERVEKVRSWLVKEDLKLFLSALEQFGKESGDDGLQRMFPARQRFINGLLRQNLVKRTRLMLGAVTEHAVKKILGNDLKTNFIKLTNANGMSDKAVIYVDCGDFCFIEGSHNFKLWVYLAPPTEFVYSYDVKQLSHENLTIEVPRRYLQKYSKSAPFLPITHSPTTWQNKLFEFLAENGISLDIEPLLSPQDYREYLRRFGTPVVTPFKTVLLERDKQREL
jgi:hypothetical protein